MVAWWIVLSCACLVSGVVDWQGLKESLYGLVGGPAAIKIVEKWDERPPDFFRDLEERSWLVIAQYLSEAQVKQIQPKEFDQMSAELAQSVLSGIRTCHDIDISFWGGGRIRHISPECVHSILSKKETVKLESLWQKIGYPVMEKFSKEMRSCWLGIDRNDFNFMQPPVLKIITSFPGVCSHLGLSFWTEERAEHISSDTLYNILTELERPVRLGRLWQQINGWSFYYFTKEMKSAFLNIDLGDFEWMRPDVLEITLSAPGVCSALGPSFWRTSRMAHVPPQCMREILTTYEVPVKLGGLWENAQPDLIWSVATSMRLSWDLFHPDDYDLARGAIGKTIVAHPGICGAFDISFWRKEMLKYVTTRCLGAMLAETNRIVALGELWDHTPHSAITRLDRWDLGGLKNVVGDDFKYMPSDLLKLIFSFDQVVYYLPRPPIRVILSSRASEVNVGSARFAALVRSVPDAAGQLLWYSTSLPENVLCKCDEGDICSLGFVVSNTEQLEWRDFFARLKERYHSAGRGEFFGRMTRMISIKADSHFCDTVLDLDECLSLPWHEPAARVNLANLAKESPFWVKMLKVCSHDDWNWLSRSKRINALVADDCEFWLAIYSYHPELLAVLHWTMLKKISHACVVKVKSILHHNPSLASFLPDNVFSERRVGELPCRLQDLSPGQIACLSENIANDKSNPADKMDQHVLSGVTLDDIKALNLVQFSSLYRTQWAFVPNGIKDQVFDWGL